VTNNNFYKHKYGRRKLEIGEFLAWWQFGVSIVMSIIILFSFQRYKEKRNAISKELLITFVMFWFALILQMIGTILQINEIGSGSTFYEDPNWISNWLIKLVSEYNITFALIMIGTYHLYKFSRYVFQSENLSKKGPIIASIFIVCIVTLAVVRYPFLSPDLAIEIQLLLQADLYSIVFFFAIIIPILRQSILLRKKVSPTDPIASNLKYLGIMMIFFIITLIMFVLETIWNISTGETQNIFSFLANILVIFTILSAYRGFYSRKK
jgi:hypothetical protein